MQKKFFHKALSLQKKKPIIFAALSKKYFYMRMFIVKYILKKGKVPINAFMSFEYFLLDTVDRDIIRNANNNLLNISDEVWIFGSISDGVMAEIKQTYSQKKKVRYFQIKNDKDIVEVDKKHVTFEDGMEKFKKEL